MNESALCLGLLFFYGVHLFHNTHILHWVVISAVALGAAVIPGKYTVPRDTRTTIEQRRQYETDIVKFFVDCYMDAVRIIIRDEFPEGKRGNLDQGQLIGLGQRAIIQAVGEFGRRPGLDAHVYKTIRINLSGAIKASA
jgi:hypothetical protein